MNAREAVLESVRSALRNADKSTPQIARTYREAGLHDTDPAGRLGLFVDRVEDYRATVVRCPAVDVEGAVAAALDGRRAVVPGGLSWSVAGAQLDHGQTAAALDNIDAVVTSATVAIAVTGTIILDHGPGQGRRALSLVPDLHICVVREDQVVHGVPDAIARLDPTRPQTWISGPSATSDIELTRVEGVHGPRTLHVILAEGDLS